MRRSNSKISTPVHFAAGPVGTLHWMAYWLASRTANLVRVLRERWREQYAPALTTRWGALTSHARDLLTRSEPTSTQQPYSSLSVAVREAQRESRYRESRYRGNASGISATT